MARVTLFRPVNLRSLTVSALSALLILAGCAHDPPATKPEAVQPVTAAADRPSESQPDSGAHFARARELYALGPSKGAEVIAELDLELRDHPENVQALLLKAMTQMGIGRLDAALATLDQLSAVAAKTGDIHPDAMLLRARIHFHKGEYETAKRTLEPYWAFFQQDANSKARYDSLMAAIAAKMQEAAGEAKPPDPPR